MCQICALSLRYQGLNKQERLALPSSEGSLNPQPLSVLVMLNPDSKDAKPSSTSNKSQLPAGGLASQNHSS